MRATILGTYGVPIAEKTGETAFCGDIFEPAVSRTDVEGQKKRWAQFGTTWSPAPATAAPVPPTPSTAPMTLSDLWARMVKHRRSVGVEFPSFGRDGGQCSSAQYHHCSCI
jgi:hypothetical protein